MMNAQKKMEAVISITINKEGGKDGRRKEGGYFCLQSKYTALFWAIDSVEQCSQCVIPRPPPAASVLEYQILEPLPELLNWTLWVRSSILWLNRWLWYALKLETCCQRGLTWPISYCIPAPHWLHDPGKVPNLTVSISSFLNRVWPQGLPDLPEHLPWGRAQPAGASAQHTWLPTHEREMTFYWGF